MSSDYFQPYNLAFDGLQAPVYPHALNDEFIRQRPAVLPPLPPPVLPVGPYTYVALEPSWLTWNPGNTINFRAIDTRRRMAMLAGSGDKEWGGIVKALPLPGLSEALQYTIYMRIVPGFVDVSGNAVFNELLYGMVLGNDLIGAPTLSPFISIHAAQNHAVLGAPIAGEMQCSSWSSYSAVNVPSQKVSCAWPMTFVRARIRQALSGGAVWSVEVVFDCSMTGEGWQPVMRYTQALPLRHVGFAQRSRDETVHVNFCDFMRVFVQPIDEKFNTNGDRPQLGST